jgi:hypothetical protein
VTYVSPVAAVPEKNEEVKADAQKRVPDYGTDAEEFVVSKLSHEGQAKFYDELYEQGNYKPKYVDHSRKPQLVGFCERRRLIQGGTQFIRELWIRINFLDNNQTVDMPARDFIICGKETHLEQMRKFLKEVDSQKQMLLKLPPLSKPAEVVMPPS